MPRKGMRSIFFFPRKAVTYSPSSLSITPRLTFSDAVMDITLTIAETTIRKWDIEATTSVKVTSLFYENRIEAGEFIKSVDGLQKFMHVLVMEDPYSEKLRHGKELMNIAMKRLQKEFYQILSMNRAHLDPESVSARSSRTSTRSSTSDFDDDDDEIREVEDSIKEVEDVSNLAMVDLRSIAECMIRCGYGKECLTVYKLIRKSIIDEGIYKLGVVKMSSSQVQKMEWNVVELKIKTWVEALKIAIKTLFNGEKILCDNIFASSEKIKESCFADISKDGADILFKFPESVIKSSKKSSKKLFRLLDMYVAISNNWLEIESIFSSESSSTVKSQAINSLSTISEFVRTEIKEFECVIQKDASKTLAKGGGIHPLTIQVVKYLITLANYSNALSDIFAGNSPQSSPQSNSSMTESLSNISFSEDSEAFAISHLFQWLVLVLLCKLDMKSKYYNNISLSYLFLANNLQYIVTKVRTSNLDFIFGEDWLTTHDIKIKQFATTYARLGWTHVIKSLPDNPKADISREEATKWFMQFNIVFEEAHGKQSECIIPDKNLREAIKILVSKKIVPVYREIYDTHKASLLGTRDLKSVIKFAPEDVAIRLSDLYFVTKGSVPGSVSSSSKSSHSGTSLAH